MPGYRVHLLGGAVTFGSLYYFITTPLGFPQSATWTILLLGVTLLGSLIPDLDITSKIQRLFYFCIIGAFLGLLLTHQWVLLLFTAGLAIVIGLLRHRTILHHPVFLALLPMPIIYYMANNNQPLSSTIFASLFFIAGCWSHLLLDFGIKKGTKRN